MKVCSSFLLVVLVTLAARGQENIGLFQFGYSTGRSEGVYSQPTGFKVNAAWEFQPSGDKWTMGGSLGYQRLTASNGPNEFSVSAVPICFVSRIMFGGESLKFFVRGQAGTHISTISYAGSLVANSDTQVGMAAGLGGGIMFYSGEKLFFSAEYEWLWLSNAFTNTGSIGTGAIGVGFRF